mmetsp:Transcript_10396/g.31776  ORF Transcript_10396/g.31776 Transcript_10396/m.31776 type:complete len:86 (-) Transcript_10396:1046-1303(-)
MSSVRIRVLFFAKCRELCGVNQVEMEIPSGTKTDELMEKHVLKKYPAMAPIAPACALSLNLEYISDPLELHDGDEVGVIPPISGG